jgi:hypothetical protein
LGLVAIAISAYASWENAAFIRESVETRGRVVEIVRRHTGRTDSARYRHLPVVEFTAADGARRSFTSGFRGDPPFAVGDELVVLYPPDRPADARLAAAWSTWGSKLRNWAVCGGALALTLGAALALAGWRLARRPRPSQ